MAVENLKVFLAAFLLSAVYQTTDCTVTTLEDEFTCGGKNITLRWNYTDPSNMSTVQWHFIDSANISKLIMVQSKVTNATVLGGFNVVHISNGWVKLINPTTANTGNYSITVTYSTSALPDFNKVQVNVYDKPVGLSYNSSASGQKITFTCTASYLGGPIPATLYIKVDGVGKSGVSETVKGNRSHVECCLKDGPAICLKDPCIPVQLEVFVSAYMVISSIAVAVTSVLIIGLIIMIIVGRLGKAVAWNLSGVDIALIIIACVFTLYSLIAGAVSVAKNRDEDKYCDTDTNCNASFGLGIASIVLAFVDVVVLVVFIKVRTVSDKPKQPNGTVNEEASDKVMMKDRKRQQEKTAL